MLRNTAFPCLFLRNWKGVLLLALDYARLTNGAFDPTLGPCIRLWKKSRRLGILPSGEERECALRACGWEKVVRP